MAKKIAIEQFTGVTPRVPNYALPEQAASHAVNARLTDKTIRPFYEPVDSVDVNSDLSANFDGYTNFFKASTNDTISWMAWTVDAAVTVLETRYNDIDKYDYPVAPEPVVVDGHSLIILLAGVDPTVTALIDDNLYSAAYTYTHTSNTAPAGAVDPQTNMTRQVIATIAEPIVSAADTYLWEVVEGHADISIDSTSIANPTFTCSTLSAPAAITETETAEATYRVTVTDTVAATGVQFVKVSFSYHWARPPLIDIGGGDGWNFGADQPYYYED
jgi:hypothetical protein